MTTIMKWYEKTVRGDSVNAVAAKANVVQTTLDRQLKKGALSAEMVVAIARAYRVDVLDSLVKAGLITREEIKAHGVRGALRDALDVEIAQEVARRLGDGDRPILDTPLS